MRIRRGVFDAIVAHAIADAPLECCGLLLGTEGSIEGVFPAANLRRSRTAYQVAPADHFAAIRAARRDRIAVIGAYHSHPATAAIPSPTDISEANDPAFVHLIVSLEAAEAEVRGFLISERTFIEVPLALEP